MLAVTSVLPTNLYWAHAVAASVARVSGCKAFNKGRLSDCQMGPEKKPSQQHRQCTHRVHQLGVSCGWWWGLLQKLATRLLLQQRRHEIMPGSKGL